MELLQEREVRRVYLRIPDKLYEEAMYEITGNNDPWFSVTLKEVSVGGGNTTLVLIEIKGQCKFRENRWKRFTMEV